MKTLKMLNPVWFFKTSFSYMEGYNKLYILWRMPRAYFKYVYYTLCGK